MIMLQSELVELLPPTSNITRGLSVQLTFSSKQIKIHKNTEFAICRIWHASSPSDVNNLLIEKNSSFVTCYMIEGPVRMVKTSTGEQIKLGPRPWDVV